TFSGLLLWLILLLDTSILTNQEAVLRGLNTIFYEKFMQLESKDSCTAGCQLLRGARKLREALSVE
nr:hypothetical protein [Nitrospiraceae bacterium]